MAYSKKKGRLEIGLKVHNANHLFLRVTPLSDLLGHPPQLGHVVLGPVRVPACFVRPGQPQEELDPTGSGVRRRRGEGQFQVADDQRGTGWPGEHASRENLLL